MVQDHLAIMDGLKKYASPKARLSRLIHAGSLIQLRRGLFVDSLSVAKRPLAAMVFGPSYLSFQYALSFHGLIPERVMVFTSASFNKNKDKVFHTPLGEYSYQYLPQRVYPYGIYRELENDQAFLIASPEKALCDSVYKISAITSVSEMETLLCENWRIDKGDLLRLDRDFISWISPLYQKRSLLALARWFSEGGV